MMRFWLFLGDSLIFNISYKWRRIVDQVEIVGGMQRNKNFIRRVITEEREQIVINHSFGLI